MGKIKEIVIVERQGHTQKLVLAKVKRNIRSIMLGISKGIRLVNKG